MKKFIFTLLMLSVAVLFFACSQNTVKEDTASNNQNQATATVAQPQPQDNGNMVNPHGDSSMQPKQPKPIVIPDDVAKKFKAVKLSVISLKDNKTISVEVPIGKETKVPNTPVSIYVEAYLPDFSMGTENITSASSEEKNPAIKIKITKNSEKYEGWLFKNFDIHKIEDPDYDYKLIGGISK